MTSSIIAGNVGGDVDFSAGAFTSAYNLIGDGPSAALFVGPGDQTSVTDPLLAPLADNDGPTPTHGLLAGSPALDAGDPAAMAGVGDTPEFDQRGAPFARVLNGRTDVGAFEGVVPAPTPGDANQDGVVDLLDLDLLGKNFGVSGAYFSLGDFNADGEVDLLDLDILGANFGAVASTDAPLARDAAFALLSSTPRSPQRTEVVVSRAVTTTLVPDDSLLLIASDQEIEGGESDSQQRTTRGGTQGDRHQRDESADAFGVL